MSSVDTQLNCHTAHPNKYEPSLQNFLVSIQAAPRSLINKQIADHPPYSDYLEPYHPKDRWAAPIRTVANLAAIECCRGVSTVQYQPHATLTFTVQVGFGRG